MSNTLLYYPYINLPETSWTVRVLLYYDNIASIVPKEYFYEPEAKYEPFMLQLVREGLVKPLDPMNELKSPRRLTKPFLDFVQSDGYKLDVKRDRFNNGLYSLNRKIIESPKTRISSEKFDYELLYSLSELGVAKRDEGNWYMVEMTTANYLMSYLASVLAGKLDMLPATNKPFRIDYMSQFRKSNRFGLSKRDKLLREIIPFTKDIDVSKILNFKEKNFKSLNHFRLVMEEIALDPKYDDDLLLNSKIKILNENREQLIAKMNESGFVDVFFGSACGIFGAFQGLTQYDTNAALMGAFPGFASAIYLALKIERPEKLFDQTGMKYLALVDKRLKQ